MNERYSLKDIRGLFALLGRFFCTNARLYQESKIVFSKIPLKKRFVPNNKKKYDKLQSVLHLKSSALTSN